MFDLPAMSTMHISVYKETVCFYSGYGILEWSSDDTTLRKAIIASRNITMVSNGVYTLAPTEINGGEIF